ncbi:small subunit processome component 20 [Caerostris extrusa]|uniref:Small subunit processome component 20 n=1 Tax=Caerostris extrusa TaxID=172846 RepID=A0AAV4MGU5_CAEEX|nr:small subunit processome component 20 [Caerostris extrusa]
MLQYGMFEKDLLPAVLSVCLKMIKSGESAEKDNALEILSESISVLKPFTECEDDVKSFSKLYLHLNSESFSEENSKTSYSVLQNFLLETLQSDLESNHLNIQSALICLPHLRFLEKDRVCAVIQQLSLKIRNVLLCTNLTETEQSTKLFAVLYQAYFAYLVIISNGDRSENCFNTNFFMDLLKKFPDSVKILRMVDYYLNNLTKSPVIDDLPDVILNVIPNLASPFHLIRRFSLRILKTFVLQEPSQNGVPSVFDICLEAESIPLDVQSYREKLKWLRKLEYEFIKKNLPTSYEEHITKAAIYYIIGMLYVNFKLLWGNLQLKFCSHLQMVHHNYFGMYFALTSINLLKCVCNIIQEKYL